MKVFSAADHAVPFGKHLDGGRLSRIGSACNEVHVFQVMLQNIIRDLHIAPLLSAWMPPRTKERRTHPACKISAPPDPQIYARYGTPAPKKGFPTAQTRLLEDLLAVVLLAEHLEEGRFVHHADVALSAAAHGDGAVLHLLVAHDELIGHLLHFGVEDLPAQLLLAEVRRGAEARRVHLIGKRLRVLGGAVGDGKHLDLLGREPHGELASEVLDEDGHEALDGAEHHAVDHDRAMLLPVLAHIFEVKALRELEVELDGAALPRSADAVLEVEVDLGTVEGAVALVDLVFEPQPFKRRPKRVRRVLPIFIRTHAVVGTGGELHMIFEPEELVHLVDELDDALDLGRDLLGGHEDVRIVLREAAHAHEAVKLAALLMAMDEAEFAHADGQILIAVRREFVHEHAARAVHGLDGALLPVDLGRIHIVLVVIPMAGGLPQRPRHDHGRLHLDIAVAAMDLTPVVDEKVFQDHAVGQEEREAAALVEEREEFERLPKQIEALEAELSELEAKLSDSEYVVSHFDELAKINERMAEIRLEDERLFERWSELEERRLEMES